jgi:hypothetical protein
MARSPLYGAGLSQSVNKARADPTTDANSGEYPGAAERFSELVGR